MSIKCITALLTIIKLHSSIVQAHKNAILQLHSFTISADLNDNITYNMMSHLK